MWDLSCDRVEGCIMEITCMSDGEWPELFSQNVGPVLNGMQQKSARSVCDNTDVTFSHPILLMPPNSTEG